MCPYIWSISSVKFVVSSSVSNRTEETTNIVIVQFRTSFGSSSSNRPIFGASTLFSFCIIPKISSLNTQKFSFISTVP